MKVKELIEKLKEFPQEAEVLAFDRDEDFIKVKDVVEEGGEVYILTHRVQ